MKRGTKGGGSNSNGTKSKMYCCYCYEDSIFYNPLWTACQMQEYCKGKMKKPGFPGFFTEFFTKGIPKFERLEA